MQFPHEFVLDLGGGNGRTKTNSTRLLGVAAAPPYNGSYYSLLGLWDNEKIKRKLL